MALSTGDLFVHLKNQVFNNMSRKYNDSRFGKVTLTSKNNSVITTATDIFMFCLRRVVSIYAFARKSGKKFLQKICLHSWSPSAFLAAAVSHQLLRGSALARGVRQMEGHVK